MNFETEGIVLRQSPYREKDAMISILTENGIVNFLARGIQSPTSKNASSCLLFADSYFSLNQRQDKFSLTQGKLIDSHMSIYSSLEKMSAIELVSEALIRFLMEEENHLFSYFKRFIELIESGFDSATLIAIMLAKIIKSTGYDLEYNNCVICGRTDRIVSVSFTQGGFVCEECSRKFKLGINDPLYLKSYRYCFMVDEKNMTHYALDKSISVELIDQFLTYLNDKFEVRELKSYEIYKKSINL